MSSAVSCSGTTSTRPETIKFQSIADERELDDDRAIMDNVLRTERQYQGTISSDYMRHQVNITPYMRAILVHWLMEVGHEYMLKRSTVNLAVNFIDRILTQTCDVKVSRLQLLGVTCLHTAAKLEEVYPPRISDFALTTDGACSIDDIKKMEMIVGKFLEWRLTPPVPHFWANTFTNFLHNQPRPPEPSAEVAEALKNAGSLGDGVEEAAAAAATPVDKKGRLTPPKMSTRNRLPRREILVEQTLDLVDACSIDVASCAFPPSLLTQRAMIHILKARKNPSIYGALTELFKDQANSPMTKSCSEMVRVFAAEVATQRCPSIARCSSKEDENAAKRPRLGTKKKPKFYHVKQSYQTDLVKRWTAYQQCLSTHSASDKGIPAASTS